MRKAFEVFGHYEELKMIEFDLVERGCFFRLKGDLHKSTDKDVAKAAYEESLNFFTQESDEEALN